MFDIAKKSFSLPESFINRFSGRQPKWGDLGLFTYKRTYARQVEGEDRLEEYWETCRRVVEGCFSIQKNHCEVNRLPWNERKAQKSAKKMFDLMWNFKFLPPGRGLWSMGTKHVVKHGGASLNNPLAENTKILTQEYGWIEIGDIEGENVHVLSNIKLYGRDESLNANAIWAPASISHVELQPCLNITYADKFGNSTTITASENHRWFRRLTSKKPWERVTSKELNVGDYLPMTKPPKLFTPSFGGFQHGFFFGDGTRSNGELHQFKDSISVLKDLFTNVVDIDNEHSVVRQCPLAWGRIPEGEYAKDQRYVYGFLAGYLAADGHVDKKYGNVSLCSARLDELLSVCELFKQLGIRVSEPKVCATQSNLVEDRNPLYEIIICPVDLDEKFFLKEKHLRAWKDNLDSRRRDWLRITDIQVSGTHKVLCATVPDYEQFVIDGFCLTSNCGFVSTQNLTEDPATPFCWLMDMSMVGVGVGFDTLGADTCEVHKPRHNDHTFVIPDTRGGWIESVRLLISAYLLRGQFDYKYDYSKIREAGKLIKGFGGVSSGPEPLIELHQEIRKILEKRIGDSLTSEDIVDIMNLIGRCVVAGNVRRSAEIALGLPSDVEFLNLKQDTEKLTHHRWASNNSVFAEVGMDYSDCAELTASNGEPGYFWIDNARAFGRLVDPATWADKDVAGANPCVEQSLHDRELCNLVETFPSKHDSLDEYKETAKIAYMYAKTVALVPTEWPQTNAVMMKNRRIGLSQSGIIKAFGRHGRRKMLRWCDEVYKYLDSLDTIYSDWLCVPKSIKKTSVKPSGTVSLLAGEPPGIHYPHSKYYIRRVRVGIHSPLIHALRKAGYKIEPCVGQENTTVVVEFPIKEEYFTRGKEDVSIWEQVANAVSYQKYWADNMVSITVTFKEHERDDIKHTLEMFEDSLKSISFLPLSGHGYAQAPYEAITYTQYTEMTKALKPIDFSNVAEQGVAPAGCDSDTCEIPQDDKVSSTV